MTTQQNRNARKTVQFALDLNEVHRISHPTDRDNQAKWFSNEENEEFGHELVRDVVRSSQMFAAGAVNLLDRNTARDFVIRCVGIEKFLAKDVRRRYQDIQSAKQEHTRIVLQAQERLSRIGEVLEEDIAHVSEFSSRRARARSRTVAMIAASVSV